MNRIIPCFDEHSSEVNKELVKQLASTNVGVFAGRHATFNNNPLLLSDTETAAFASKVNIAALMRRIYVGIVVNDAPVGDIPTHVLVVANGVKEDAIDIDEGELESIVSEFVAKDFPVPEVVFLNANDEDLAKQIETYMVVTPVAVVEPTPEPEPLVEEKPVAKKKK